MGGRKKKEAKKVAQPSKERNKGIANAILRGTPESWRAQELLLVSCSPRQEPYLPGRKLGSCVGSVIILYCTEIQRVYEWTRN